VKLSIKNLQHELEVFNYIGSTMRKNILPFLALLGIVIACNTSPTATGRNGIQFKTPAEYNDYIITRQQQVARLIDQFAAASAENTDSAQAVLEKSSRITGEYLTDLSAMSDFKGDTAFRNAAVNNFTFYKRIFDNEYKTLLAINSKGNKVSAADAQRAQVITQSLTTEEAALDKRFTSAQKDFAQKNKLSLEATMPAASDTPNTQN
jgi:hypothetical protein